MLIWPGCSRTFMSTEAMSTHLKKVHGDATVFTEASFEGSLGSDVEGKDSLPVSYLFNISPFQFGLNLEQFRKPYITFQL